ncbi:MAG TPA: hypothetical protein VLP30_06105 [Desulfatirhabdiaceae bacterium]|nr:hypothetical protein [Desulfatirhabdiaceae bacterium]
MERLIIAATISFGLGAFGYVLLRFFLMPIRRYSRIKSDIRAALSRIAMTGGASPVEKEQVRSLAVALSECYYDDLPVYYRLLLTRRQEQPIEASRMILSFTGIKKPEQAQKRMAEILSALRIQTHVQ